MAQIDTSMHPAHADARQDGPTMRDEQGKSWLRQLEAAGWKGILDTMHNFPGASGFLSTNDLSLPARTPRVNGSDSAAEEGHPDPKKTETSTQGPPWTMRQPALVQPRAGSPLNGATYLAYGMQHAAGASEEGEAAVAPRRQAGLVSRDVVAESKILMLSTQEHGVELWVRDTKVTGAQMQMLLADVRRNIQNLGGEVVKASLNGRLVYSDQSARVKPKQSKGD